jgi:hypothetical protein
MEPLETIEKDAMHSAGDAGTPNPLHVDCPFPAPNPLSPIGFGGEVKGGRDGAVRIANFSRRQSRACSSTSLVDGEERGTYHHHC